MKKLGARKLCLRAGISDQAHCGMLRDSLAGFPMMADACQVDAQFLHDLAHAVIGSSRILGSSFCLARLQTPRSSAPWPNYGSASACWMQVSQARPSSVAWQTHVKRKSFAILIPAADSGVGPRDFPIWFAIIS